MAAKQPSNNGDPGESLRRLSAAAARGDEAAFHEIHTRLDGGLRRFLLRRIPTNRELLDDLSQRTWVAAWESIATGRYDPERAAFSTFLYGIAHNLLLQHFRRARAGFERNNDLDRTAGSLFSETGDPAEFLKACELLDCIRACLRTDGPLGLSETDREILAGVSRGETERELARRLGLSPSTINSRKQLSLKTLGDFLRRQGFHFENAGQLGGFGE